MLKRVGNLTSGYGECEWLDSVSIEPMQPGDVEAVCAIDRASFPSSWSAESYLRDLRNPSVHYLVARLEGEVIGYAGMWVIGQEAHITTLAVHPCCRRCGLGRRLCARLIETAQRRGATEVTLEARTANLAARALYQHLGFQPRCTIPRYYADTGEDAVVMALRLDN